MDSIINRVFNWKVDDEVHSDFVKFGRGVFKDKYLVNAKRQKGGVWSIKTSYEFANYFVKSCVEELLGNELSNEQPIAVSGVVVSTKNLKDELPFTISRVKQFAGVKQAVIDSEAKPSDIISAVEKLPKAFFALSFKTNNSELKIKAKAPKSAKPSQKGEGKQKADFCSLKTSNNDIIRDLLFDIKDIDAINEISISHEIEVKKINIPKEIADPVEMREKATREGVIKRKVVADGKIREEVREFAA